MNMTETGATDTTNALASLSHAIEEVAAKVSQSVVGINSKNKGNGSGVVWNTDGHIVTCSHLVRGVDEVDVSFSNGKSFPARIVGNDPYSDIALLKIQLSDNDTAFLKPIVTGDSESLKTGQFVLAFANPSGEYPSITEGVITSQRSSIRGGGWRWASTMDNIVITDTSLNPGYSGGPLVDAEGKMIGINAAYVWSRGIAVRGSKVNSIADQLAKYGAIKSAYLGIIMDIISLPPEISAQLEPYQEEGLMILSVVRDTAAKKAGLLIGDIVVKFDNKPLTNIHDLRRQLSKQDIIGKSVKLAIIRGEKKIELAITPEEAARSG
jgi:S1-C subfamily serine protease